MQDKTITTKKLTFNQKLSLPKKPKPLVGEFWAIKGRHGFYVGTWQTRGKAIGAHLNALRRTWEYCRAKGDEAVKVLVTEVTK